MFEEIHKAAITLRGTVTQTALLRAQGLGAQGNLYLKTENLQRTGSFKLRGAYYKMSTLTPKERQRGVIACSAGNHAQGVALAAQALGITATICIPQGAPLQKIAKTRSYGAQVVLVPGVYDDAYNHALALQKESGAVFVHPFDDPKVIAGQGTVGLEIMSQLPEADIIFVPIGGGGLAAGVAVAIKTTYPHCKVYGVQAAGAPSMKNAILSGEIQTLDTVTTIADGIAVKRPGTLTYQLCKQYLDDIFTVTDEEISGAMLSLIENYKMVAEGAGAAAVAAAMFDKINTAGKNVVAIVSGGNIDVNILSRVITSGLIQSGRMLEFSTLLPDKPGQLMKLLGLISGSGANIVAVNHHRFHAHVPVGNCVVEIVLETNDNQHGEKILELLAKNAYKPI